MTLCAYCGVEAPPGGLCSRHTFAHGDDWAKGNRVMCDFLHRGVLPPVATELVDSELESIECAA